MSSPDPLTDSIMADVNSLPPSSAARRITRSQSSQRFIALSSSPRGQMVELQAGRRLDMADAERPHDVAPSTRRRLFQSPTSTSSSSARRPRIRTTTTTVPLRESAEDEDSDATPKQRAPQRKVNGTPMPGAGSKRRAESPIKRTPHRRRTMASSDVEESQPERSVQATPPTRRNLRSRKTPSVAPSSERGTLTTPKTSTTQGRKRRRQALAPDELTLLVDQGSDPYVNTTILPPVTSDDEVDLVRAPSESPDIEAANSPVATAMSPSPASVTAVAAEPDSDIWISNMSNQATPKGPTRTRDVIPESSPRYAPAPYLAPQKDLDVETSQAGDFDNYGYGDFGPARSDASSLDEPLGEDDPVTTAAPTAYDTIAQGEDFSMIFMDSIPSLQTDFHSSVAHLAHDELGDETSMIVNNTLESLRQEHRHQPVDEERTGAAAAPEQPFQPDNAEEETGEEEMDKEEILPNRRHSSSPNTKPSPSWSRSPRKGVNSSPLRHRVLKYSAMQAEEAASSRTSLSPTSRRRLQSVAHEAAALNPYDDSFSEIPEEVLTAAAPGQPKLTNNRSSSNSEDGVDQVQPADSQDEELDEQNRGHPDEVYNDHPDIDHEEQGVQYAQPAQEMELEEDESLQTEEEMNKAADSDREDEDGVVAVEDDEENSYDEGSPDHEVTHGLDHTQEREVVEGDIDGAVIAQELDERQDEVRVLDQEVLAKETELYEEQSESGSEEAAAPEFDSHEEQDEAEVEIDVVDMVSDGDKEEEEEDEDEDEEDEVDAEEGALSNQERTDAVQQDDEMEDEPGRAASIANTVARSDSARLPTPVDTPPQDDLEEMNVAEEIQKHESRPAPSPRYPSRSPGHFGRVPRITIEHPEEPEDPDESAEQEELEVLENPEELEEPDGSEKLQDEEMEDDQPRDEQGDEDQVGPELHQQQDVAEAAHQLPDSTPPKQISSPLQDPQSLQQESLLDKTVRPHLSAIVRAGRVLQSITSDPPSPEGREKQLGSPFRRSGSKESWSGSRDSQTSRRMSRSPLQPRNVAQAAGSRGSPAEQEPLQPSTGNTMERSFLSAPRQSKSVSVDRDLSPSRHSAASSMHITPPSDAAMSWIEREGPLSPQLRGDNTLREASRVVAFKAARTSPIEQAAPASEQHSASPQPTREETPGGRDDDTDIWELEAQRETPRPARQQPFGKRIATSNHRRGTIPSPWTKRSVHRPAISRMISQSVPDSSHLVEDATLVADQTHQSSEPDEYSLLAQRQQEEAAAKNATDAPESAVKNKRFDLSSFFSSPASIPGMLAQKFLPGKTQSSEKKAAQPSTQMSTIAQAPPVVPTSSMFPQVPPNENHPDDSNRNNVFSPVRRRHTSTAEPMEQPQQIQRSDPEVEHQKSSSPATPEKIPPPTVAEVQSFTPRPRQTSQTFFQPSSIRPAAVTPPRMQLSHDDIHRWTQQTTDADTVSSDYRRPLLRPLPPKNASPTKSSLRSPLKPHTPGRVVEFNSSVLSPAEQAKARQERRLSNSMLSQQSENDLFGQPLGYGAQYITNKENSVDNSDISMEDAPPLLTDGKQVRPGPLSQSTWTRRHWLFLDEILHLRRQAPFAHRYEPRAGRYLGKTVKSHGMAMTLEQWHIDCVDAFKAEVGGWDEGAVAKRLFALILGEQRRQQARRGRAPSAMFH